MTFETTEPYCMEIIFPYSFILDLCKICSSKFIPENKCFQWSTKNNDSDVTCNPVTGTSNTGSKGSTRNRSSQVSAHWFTLCGEKNVRICIKCADPNKKLHVLSSLQLQHEDILMTGQEEIAPNASITNFNISHEKQHPTESKEKSIVVEQSNSHLSVNINSNFLQSSVPSVTEPLKRKRGRPKKVKVSTEHDGASNQPKSKLKSTDNAQLDETACITIVNNMQSTKRYGLRGVKLSEKIMNAEKNDVDIPESDEENILQNSLSRLYKEENNAMKSNQDSEKSDTEFRPGYDNTEEDEDFKPYYTGKTLKRKRRITLRSLSGSKKKARRHSRIDYGDEIPKYVRRKRNKSKVAECKFCNKNFCDYTGVDKHVRLVHGNLKEAEEYLKSISSKKITKCSVCEKEFADRFRAQAHELSEHFRGDTFRCKHCKKLFKNMQALRNHISMVHNVKGQPYQCKLCSSKFKWAMTLVHHIAEIHEGKLPFVCEICQKKFARKTQLKFHQRIHGMDPSKKLECGKCGKIFWYECNYKRHMSFVHETQRERFHCSYCGKGFSMKNSMVSHVQHVHLNIFPYKCTCCHKGFRRKTSLQDHMKLAHNVTSDSIITKTRRFKYGKNDEELFFCSHCSQSFCYKTKMIEHMHIDHGKEFPFMCSICCQGFLAKSYLLTHLQQGHDKTIEESQHLIDQDDSSTSNEVAGITTFDLAMENTGEQNTKNNIAESLLPGEKSNEETNDTSVIHISHAREVMQTSNDSGPVLFQVCTNKGTIHYIIEPSADGNPTVLPEELSSLLLSQGQAVQVISDDAEACFVADIHVEGNGATEILDPSTSAATAENTLGLPVGVGSEELPNQLPGCDADNVEDVEVVPLGVTEVQEVAMQPDGDANVVEYVEVLPGEAALEVQEKDIAHSGDGSVVEDIQTCDTGREELIIGKEVVLEDIGVTCI